MDLTQYLYPLDLNPNTSPVLFAGRTSLQQVYDRIYLSGPGGVENWLGQVETWVTRNTVARNNWIAAGNDPNKFIQDEFTMHAPSRTVVDYADDGVLDCRTDTSDNQPKLAALFLKPVLSAFVPAKPQPGITDRPPASQQQDQQNSVAFSKISENNLMLRAICKFFNLTVEGVS